MSDDVVITATEGLSSEEEEEDMNQAISWKKLSDNVRA